MSPDIQELKRLAEAATQGRWLWWPGSDDVLDSDMGKFVTEDGAEICNFGNCETYYPTAGDPPNPFDAAYIAAASPSTILALIEALKRQGEALEMIAKGKYGKCPIEGHWPPEKPCTLCGDLGFFDDEPQYNPAKDGHCVEGGARVIARAALKETTDV